MQIEKANTRHKNGFVYPESKTGALCDDKNHTIGLHSMR